MNSAPAESTPADSWRAHILGYLASLLVISQMVLAILVERGRYRSLRYIGVLFGVSAIFLIFVPMLTLRRYGRVEPGKDYMQTTIVVERGPFSFVRHPQYLAYMFISVTFMLATQHWLVIALGVPAIALFYLYTLSEEVRLKEKFGEQYEAYMARVPRFNLVAGAIRAARRGRAQRKGSH
ncbi:MAG: isoprenylcysteine carboxylmethyltransferase family protein [Gemmatimonadota bacterium]|nr:MAG: isoprenylcysteine carboxylmethyltransferase family protein [Gemmatimonadota bacterium]